MLTHERAFAAQRVFGQPGPALGVTLYLIWKIQGSGVKHVIAHVRLPYTLDDGA